MKFPVFSWSAALFKLAAAAFFLSLCPLLPAQEAATPANGKWHAVQTWMKICSDGKRTLGAVAYLSVARR